MSDIDFNKIISEESDFSSRGESVKNNVSPAVIKRLPRYFRYLRELIRNGKTRISSGELSDIMNVTASQIRQDLNCFGGFGQQGYGYNVNYLYAKICEILGVGRGFCAVIIGAGNLGSALVRNPMFEKRGVDVIAMFDVSEDIVGKTISGVPVFHMNELEQFCKENCVDIAVLTLPKDAAAEAADAAVKGGVLGFWNFTGRELDYSEQDIAVENVHLGDSLMTLTYELGNKKNGKDDNENRI